MSILTDQKVRELEERVKYLENGFARLQQQVFELRSHPAVEIPTLTSVSEWPEQKIKGTLHVRPELRK